MKYALTQLKSSVRKIRGVSYKPLFFIPLMSVLLASGIYGLAQYKNYVLEEEAQSSAFKVAREATVSAGQYEAHLLRNKDLTLRVISYIYQQDMALPSLKTFINDVIDKNGDKSMIVVTDAKGSLLLPESGSTINVADRDYFIAQKNSSTDDIYLSLPYFPRAGSNKNHEVVSISRRLVGTDGKFQGVVAIAMNPADLIFAANKNMLGRHGFSAVIGLDGVYRSVQFGNGPVSPKKLNVTQIGSLHSGAKFISGSSFPDHRPRFVVWNKVPGAPLITMAGIDVNDSMAEAIVAGEENVRAATLLSLFTLFSGFVAAFLMGIIQYQRRDVEVTNDLYRKAAESTPAGIFILEAVRNRDDAIVDFRFTDYNSKAESMLGFDQGKLQDVKFSAVATGEFGVQAASLLLKLMTEKRTIEVEEYLIHQEGALNDRWVSFRIVPYDNGVTVTMQDITAEKSNSEAVAWQEVHDPVTGLPNRAGFHKIMPKMLHAASLAQQHVALFFIDVDDFKLLNDTFGHTKGDALLNMIGTRLGTIIRPGDMVCRLGSDEFAMAITGHFDSDMLATFAKRLMETMSEPFSLEGRAVSLGASIGISTYPEQGIDTSQLLQYADLAMVGAKDAGKGSFRFFEHNMYEQADRRLSIEQDLRLALDKNELFLLYQPKIDLITQTIVGMEALIRWKSPTRGMVSPLDFINIAERTGLILPIGNFVIEQACRQLVLWREAGLPLLPVSVNISPKQLRTGDLVQVLERALNEFDVPANLLQIELTESSMMDNVTLSQQQLQQIKALGIKILVDDFGTGYSSLALLKRFEVDVLKVDRSFVMDIPGDPEDCAILTAIVSMAAALHMEVVAEGVETTEQVSFLKAQGCESCQGFFFSKPISPEDMSVWLEKLA